MVDRKFNLLRILRLFILYAKMDLAWLLRDTKICLLAISADFISNIAAVTGVFMLAWRFNGVGGMDRYEVLFMLGYVTSVTGLFQLFFANCNTGHISRRIGRGQVEHMLIQPLPMPLQLVTEGFIPVSGSSNLISGTIIIITAISNLIIQVNVLWVALLIASLTISVAIILGLSYLFSSMAFYAPVQAEEISTYVIDDFTGELGKYPLSGMSTAIQAVLVTILPAGLLGWFPSLALLGKTPLQLPAYYPLLVAAALFFVTSKLFKKGLNHYVKTGANRYSAVGHRR